MVEVQKEVYIENRLDYGKFILDPAINEKYKEITKDYPLSNLDDKKLKECELRQEILNIIVLNNCIPWLPNSFESFERDQHTTLQLNRSKNGFQSKLEKSNLTGDSSDISKLNEDKTKTVFEGRG